MATAAAAAPRGTRTADTAASKDLTLDALARMGVPELTRLYQQGGMPSDLSALDGAPRGRMLALVGPAGRGLPAAAIRRLAALERFPWRGKSFRSHGKEAGEGINRVLLLGDKFRFETREEPSAMDGAPCIRLDYDLPENPFFIRRIRDELREVAPGLFLGPAMLDVAPAPRLVLYFAIDHT